MANQKLTALGSIPAIDRAADLIYIVDVSAGTSNKVTPNFLLNITGAPLGTTDSATISNKILDNSNTLTVKDTNLIVQDEGDTTKQFKFQASGITTATTRTFTVPNFDATLATLAGTETLTNKTLTSPTINTATIANPTLTVNTISEFTGSNGVTVAGLNIKNSALNTANSVITTNITDAAVTPAKLVSGTGASWGWQAYTPSLVNITIGTGGSVTNVARYIQIGKTVFAKGQIVLGSSGASVGSGTTFTLPVTASSSISILGVEPIGQVNLVDSGIQQYFGVVYLNSTTVASFQPANASGTITTISLGVTSTSPFTWGASDGFLWSICYEVA